MRRSFRASMVCLAGALSVAACVSGSSGTTPATALDPSGRSPGLPLRVVTTTSIVADVVGEVGGDAIALTTVLQPGLDPHDYEPTPRELQDLARSDAIFLSGLGLESGFERAMIDSDLGPPLVSLSEGLETFDDPHVWLDPRLVRVWVDNAARALGALDPAHAADYDARAERYRRELEALDRRLEARIAEIPGERRVLVSEHEMLGHLADRYGLEVVGSLIPSTSSAAEPSPRDLAELQAVMDARGVRVIVVAMSSGGDLAQTLADDRGARVVRLYIESLSEPGGPADTYLRLMEYNLAAIVDALKG